MENSLFGSEDKNGRFSRLLLTLMPTEKLGGSFWGFTAKQHCRILLSNWSRFVLNQHKSHSSSSIITENAPKDVIYTLSVRPSFCVLLRWDANALSLAATMKIWAFKVCKRRLFKSIWDPLASRDSDYARQAVILQLFVRMLRGCSAVTLQKCFYGQEASLNSSSSRGSHLWANCSFKHVYSSSVFTFISWRGEVSRCSPLIWVSDAVVRASYSDVTTRVTVSYWSNIWLREF